MLQPVRDTFRAHDSRIVRAARLSSLLFSLVWVQASAAQPDPYFCGLEDESVLRSAGSGSAIVPNFGSVNALFILARFADENRASWTDGWPIDPQATSWDVKPAWADSLLESDDGPTYPQIDGSITQLMHLMSRGALRFRGTVFDSVVVLPSVSTFQAGTKSRDVVRAAIDSVDATGFDWSDYTFGANADSIQYVCVVFRGNRVFHDCDAPPVTCASPAAYITTNTGETGLQYPGNPPPVWRTATSGSIVASWRVSYANPLTFGVPVEDYPSGQPGTLPYPPTEPGCTCSATSLPVALHLLAAYRETIVHEIGHSLYQASPVLGSANHIWCLGNWDWMFSNGHGGIMHAGPRRLVGWLDPIVVTQGQDVTLTIYDSTLEGIPTFTSARSESTCVVIAPTWPSTQYFILENRRSSTAYTKPYPGPGTWSHESQPGSGLLITLVNESGLPYYPPCPGETHPYGAINQRDSTS